MVQNLDGKYYGYVPSDDRVNIQRTDPNAIDCVTGVLVVYVRDKKNHKKKIVAYCRNVTMYGTSQDGRAKDRIFTDTDGSERVASYSI